ncbi:MAG: hypothetical protein QM820_61755 [Minicystis sp.]
MASEILLLGLGRRLAHLALELAHEGLDLGLVLGLGLLNLLFDLFLLLLVRLLVGSGEVLLVERLGLGLLVGLELRDRLRLPGDLAVGRGHLGAHRVEEARELALVRAEAAQRRGPGLGRDDADLGVRRHDVVRVLADLLERRLHIGLLEGDLGDPLGADVHARGGHESIDVGRGGARGVGAAEDDGHGRRLLQRERGLGVADGREDAATRAAERERRAEHELHQDRNQGTTVHRDLTTFARWYGRA